MKYYESPQVPVNEHLIEFPSLFLAGGITDCPDWQKEMCDLLKDTNLTLLNPRRADFPMDDPKAAEKQIKWEHTGLKVARAISFWFPAETLCPIVLFELGAWSHWRQGLPSEMGSIIHEHKPIFVGVHPKYKRRQDVQIQMKLQRPEVVIAPSLKILAGQVAAWSREFKSPRKFKNEP